MLNNLYSLSRRYLETKYKPYYRFTIKDNLFKHRLSILIGQRGVGKTTIIIQHLLKQTKNDCLSKKILYIPADHFLLGTLSLYEIAEQFSLLGGKTIAFDEIHKYTDWSKELKSIYDTFPDLKIICSGSSALEIHKGTHDLTRRAIVSKVKGLSFREYLELDLKLALPVYSLKKIIENHEEYAHSILKILNLSHKKILPIFDCYLQTGYYPYFLELKDKTLYLLTLEKNFHTIIESDLAAIYPALTGHSIKKIKQLLTFTSRTVPFIPHWKKIKTLIEIGDERTLKTYFKYLEDAGLIRMVMKYSKKMRAIETPEKIYLNNTNQLYAISLKKQNSGTIRETFFLNMLSSSHEITIPDSGDFIVDGEILFEVGGKNKDCRQIKHAEKSCLACDGIEEGVGNKIPLWLFGFLY